MARETEITPESLIDERFDQVLFDMCREDNYVGIYREIQRRMDEARAGRPLWQILGLPADPECEFDLVIVTAEKNGPPSGE